VIRAAALALAMASPAPAQEIVAALSQSNVSIDYSFSGSEIMVFGAVRGAPPGADHDVIITVSGPLVPITVRRKERVAGIWVNAEAAEIDQAPSFYAVATTGPFEEVLTRTEDLRHAVSVPKAIRAVGSGAQDPAAFVEALVRIRRAEGIYATAEGAVTLRDGTLFDTAIALPPDLVEGDYETRILLTEEGRVVAVEKAVLAVRKVGLERFLYGLAHDSPVLYGTLSLVIAVAAGWGASAAFRLMRS
jgi:uncharacterized protein (TIGR02186 family)